MIKRIKSIIHAYYWGSIRILPFTRCIYETRDTQTPVTIRMLFMQKVLRFNGRVYWPVHFSSVVSGWKNIYAGIETCPGYMPGCYIQGMGKIYIGDYTQISANVGMITANHDMHDNRKHLETEDIWIGKYCWIAMNVMILPGIELGDYTVVGAGAVVTKSFPEGYCVIAGNPARVIRHLQKEDCVFHRSNIEYNGYIKSQRFEAFRQRKLNV